MEKIDREISLTEEQIETFTKVRSRVSRETKRECPFRVNELVGMEVASDGNYTHVAMFRRLRKSGEITVVHGFSKHNPNYPETPFNQSTGVNVAISNGLRKKFSS